MASNYEITVNNITKNLCNKDRNIPFNETSVITKGYLSKNWGRCSIVYDDINNEWKPCNNSKLPKCTQDIFYQLVKDINKIDNLDFIGKKITFNEWKQRKRSFKPIIIPIDRDSINKIYLSKGYSYIQISNYGLYCLDKDIYNYNVPKFDVPQKLCIQVKVHKKITENGCCDLSITASCKPKIWDLQPSSYSLDSLSKIPKNLKLNMNIFIVYIIKLLFYICCLRYITPI